VKPHFDVIVLGLGGMGSAAAYELAKRGQRVLGLEQFHAVHANGSSHGLSRMTRQAYFEDPCYIPLLLRAYESWRELECASNQKLLTITGGIMLGQRHFETVDGTFRSARQYNLPHELLDAKQIRQRHPMFTPCADTVGVFENNAGYVVPDLALRANLDLATRAGATLQFGERALEWQPAAGGVLVKTTRGTYAAGQLVISAGPWVQPLVKELPVRVERKILFWFEPAGGIEPFQLGNFTVWGWEIEAGTFIYGFPATNDVPGGVKVAAHREPKFDACHPDTIDRQVHPEEIELMRQRLAPRIPALAGRCLATATCLYTHSPDEHFVLDRHPAHRQVLVVSPCSGHGFKFAPVIGEIVADLVTTGATRFNLDRFCLSRLAVG
jgi:sarcosine oxidase